MVFLGYAALIIFNPMEILPAPGHDDIPFVGSWYATAAAPLLVAGYVASGLFAVRAWRRKRWAAVTVNLSVLAMLAVALFGALD